MTVSYLKRFYSFPCILALPFLIDGVALLLVQKPIATMAIKEWLAGRHWYDKSHYGLGPYGEGLATILVIIFVCIITCKDIENKLSNPSLNIDLVLSNDKEWIEQIKRRSKHKEKIIAYSKDGAIAARKKARALGLEKCFIDFKSAEEINAQYKI